MEENLNLFVIGRRRKARLGVEVGEKKMIQRLGKNTTE
jgi:hypothetical protein